MRAFGHWLLLVPVLIVCSAIVGLLLFVIWVGFSRMVSGSPEGFNGFANYVRFLSDPAVGPALTNTVSFTAVSLAVAFAFGVPLAWLAERTDLPGRWMIWTAMLASLIIPGFLLGMGWLFLAHPRIGLINVALMGLFHLSDAPLPITNVIGMGWVEGIALAPLIFILVAPSIRMLNPVLEEAAGTSGASFWETTCRITLPLMLPALLAAAIYSAINAIGAFDVPAIIGLSARIYTFSTLMYTMSNPVYGYPDYSTPAAGGSLMIVFALILTVVYARVLAKARRFQVVGGKMYRPVPFALGSWTAPAAGFALVYGLLALALPLVLTLAIALLPHLEPLSLDTIRHLTPRAFEQLPWDLITRGALHTAVLVATVPLVVVALSVAFSWLVLRTNLRFRGVLDAVALLPHAIPAVLFGLGATLAALFVFARIVPIYGTVAMIVAVYSIAFVSFGTRLINSSMIQIHRELEEAAEMSGAESLTVIGRIIVPLLRPATFALWIFTVLLCLRELTLAAFVTTPRNITLPMVTWFLWSTGQLSQAAAVAIVIVVALVPFLLLFLAFRSRVEAVF